MAEFTGTAQLNGFMYEIYDKIVDPIPESAKLVKEIPYKGGAIELGNKLHMNVVVSDEGGFTHAASGAGAFATNAAVSFETQDAQVDGFQILLQSSVDYESAAKASSSKKAFLELVGKKLQNVVASSKRRLECEVIHGQQGVGDFDTVAVAAGSGYLTLTCSAATWAPMIWQGKKNHLVVFYDTSSNAAISTYGFTVTSVAITARQVKFTEINSGDAATLGSAVGSNPARAFWYSTVDTSKTLVTTGVFKSMAGVAKIAANTTATLFNIDPTLYDVWQGNTLDCGSAALSMKKIMDGCGQLADRGVDGDLDCFVSNRAWSNINNDQAALRRYGAEVKEAKNGSSSIKFHYQDAVVSLRGHGMIKGGHALLLELPKWKRIGAQDFSFKTPGLEEGKDIFWHDPSKAGFSYRYYGNQACFCEMPSHQLVFTSIVNS